jgi:tRNA1Val (adenine37-N6)-methyltransferase
MAASLQLEQPARGAGYRVNADAFILARFAQQKRAAARVCDLGAGVGAVALSMLQAGAAARALLIEIDPHAAAFAASNAVKNDLDGRVEVVCGDVVAVARDRRGHADLVVCNPPYVTPGRGRVPASKARARARMGNLDHFVEAARLVAGRRARVVFIYPSNEAVTLTGALRRFGLEPKRIAYVHPNARSVARLVLVETQAAKPGGLIVEPPIIER